MHIGIVNRPSNFHTQKWANALHTAGAKVTIFSFEDYELPHIECVKIPLSFAPMGKENYGSYVFSGKNLFQLLKKHEVSIVNPINISPMGVLANHSGFRPMVSIAMGADILEYPPQAALSPLRSHRSFTNSEGKKTFIRQVRDRLVYHLYKYQVHQCLKNSDLITGDNWVLINAIHDWFGIQKEKLVLNRWGVEEELFATTPAQLLALRKKFRIAAGHKVILSPRGVMPIYQGDIILSAFEKLLKQGVKDVHFIMLSAGYPIPESIEKQARALESQYENFYFHRGVLPREEVYALWNLVDMFVSAPIYDGYSNALAEGRYIGAIPVVNDIPATQEVLSHKKNAWIVNPFDSEHLSGAITEILSNFQHWKSTFAAENRQWIKEHSLLRPNIQAFLRDCERVLPSYL